MTREDLLKYENRIFEDYAEKLKGMEDKKMCQYRTNKSTRYCRATSQTSCKGCRFFSLSIAEKRKVILEALKAQEELIGMMALLETDLKDKIDNLNTMMTGCLVTLEQLSIKFRAKTRKYEGRE